MSKDPGTWDYELGTWSVAPMPSFEQRPGAWNLAPMPYHKLINSIINSIGLIYAL